MNIEERGVLNYPLISSKLILMEKGAFNIHIHIHAITKTDVKGY